MKRKESEYQQRIEYLMKRLTEIEKYPQELDRRKNEEEEKRLREEQERKKKEEEERKQKEELKRIGKWKLTKAPYFNNNIINAAKNCELSSVVYLLAHGTSVNSKDSYNEFLYLISLLFIRLLKMVILVLLNI